jgi:hypothetical protein
MTQHDFIDATARRSDAGTRSIALLLCSFLLAGCSIFRGETASDDREKSDAALPSVPGPGKFHHRESQYVFYSDFQLNPTLPLFKELSDMREQICRELQLPPSNTVIQVFLFEDQERYEKFMRSRYSELPVRRAFFIKQPRNGGNADDLLVFTFWGKDVRQDLRHELTHGILHSVLKDVPLWLDEGLAEVYELPPENNGVNPGHMEQIRKTSFQPNLAKLEQLSEVKHMQRPEYREAWAWAHFMLRGKPESKTALLDYLQTLRVPNPTGQLLPKLREVHPSPNEALVEHLSRLDKLANVSR